jgi:hypothetical protein
LKSEKRRTGNWKTSRQEKKAATTQEISTLKKEKFQRGAPSIKLSGKKDSAQTGEESSHHWRNIHYATKCNGGLSKLVHWIRGYE